RVLRVEIGPDYRLAHLRVRLVIDRLLEVGQLEQVVLLDKGQDVGGDGEVVVINAGGEDVEGTLVVVQREADLLEIVRRFRPRHEEPGAQEPRQERREQQRQKRDEEQQLEERQTRPGIAVPDWNSSQKSGRASPPLLVLRAFSVSNATVVRIARTLPSHMPTLRTGLMARNPDSPPLPPQSTSGLSLLIGRVMVNVLCRKR